MTEQDYTDFMLALREVQSKIAKPDLMKVGKNFRCISESAILDVINPILANLSIDYNIEVIEHDLKIIEADKFIFVATCKVRLTFTSAGEEVAFSEALGMGIDDGDKAMGKAYTYAVKYALLKKFRLQYADDPDAEASQPISSKTLNKSEENKAKSSSKEPKATQKMLDYLHGLTIQCSMSYEAFKAEFGFYPNDKDLLMKDVRAAIETLKVRADEDLPF